MRAKSIASALAYQKAHPEQHAAHERARRAEFDDAHRAHERERGKHRAPEQRAYRLAHLEQAAAAQREWRAAHPGVSTAWSARWHAAHPERRKATTVTAGELRRARERGLPSTLTTTEWLAIVSAYDGRCAYCGERPEALTQDHVIPVSLGGGTTAENIVPACATCNFRKGNRPWEPSRP